MAERFHLVDATRDARVSTVYLGGGEYRYETMVFGGMLDDYCMRYKTEREARRGHRETYHRVRDIEEGFYTTETRN